MAAKSFLDELVQVISVQADTRAYDVIEKKNKQVIQSSVSLGKVFRRAFGALGAYFGGRALIRYADQWTNIDSILKMVTKTDEERLGLQEKLFKITQDTRQEMESTVDLYRRVTVATEKLGVSENNRLQATETINKSLLIGGGTSTANTAALIQLGQGLSADALRGQELNSILEQAPRLAKAIADGLGMKVGDLRGYAEKNKGIKANQVLTALLSQSEKVNEEFKKVNMTVGQSLTVFSNSFGRFVSKLDKAEGITGGIAKSIIKISNFIDKSSDGLIIIFKYMKQIFFLILAIKAVNLARSLNIFGLDLILLNLKSGMGLIASITNGLKLASISAWGFVLPFIKLLAVLGLIKEVIDTIRGKDTYLADAAKTINSTNPEIGNTFDRSNQNIKDLVGDGVLGQVSSTVAKPLTAVEALLRNEAIRGLNQIGGWFKNDTQISANNALKAPGPKTEFLFPPSDKDKQAHPSAVYNPNVTINVSMPTSDPNAVAEATASRISAEFSKLNYGM
jgi:tape measure domain-containing protein